MLVLSPIELPRPDEQVKHLEPNTVAFVQSNQLGDGTLFISASKLIWRSDDGQGFVLTYPQVSLHAISRDLSNFPSECLYLMYEPDDTIDTNSDSEGSDEPLEINELRFVPRDLSKLDAMYRALCECQLLHPDPQDSVSEETDEEDEEENNQGDHPNDGNGLDHEPMQIADGQFDDANN